MLRTREHETDVRRGEVAEDRLNPAERAERGSYCGCIAGAFSIGEYEQSLVTPRSRRGQARSDDPGDEARGAGELGFPRCSTRPRR
jgi:hypothetical protein